MVSFTALSLLMMLLTFSAFVSVQANGQAIRSNTPPDMPENIHVYTVIGLIVTITAATALWKRKKLYNHNQNPS